MSTVKFFNGNKMSLEVNPKVARGIEMIFNPSSARATVTGEDRGLASQALKAYLPKLGKFDSIVIDSDEETITIRSNDLPALLDKITYAYRESEALRKKLASTEADYKSVRTVVVKNPKDKNSRGRKAKNLEAEYEAMFS